MKELGGLQEKAPAFAERGVSVVAVSVDDLKHAADVQGRFPDLTIVSDEKQALMNAVAIRHEKAGLGGVDTNMPTTFLVDGKGDIRWVHRPSNVMERIPADELLQAVDDNL